MNLNNPETPARLPRSGSPVPGVDAAVRVLCADWLFPVASPPIREGAVAVGGGAILGVGRRREIRAAFPGGAVWELEGSALLPGLVNCHTHLELGPLPAVRGGGSHVDFLLAVIAARRAAGPAGGAGAAAAAAMRLLASGITAVGDVSSAGTSLDPLRRAGLRGVVYRELLGVDPAATAVRMEAARQDLARLRAAAAGSRIAVGLSPHSPYGVSGDLFAACQGVWEEAPLPIAIHAAESVEETAFIRTGGGAIADRLYPAVGGPVPPAGGRAASPVAYLEAVGALAWRPLLVHAVHVDEADIARMARAQVAVAHCPRSNARLAGGRSPVAALRAAGIPVGLGTDSLASVETLELWDEMRAALAGQAGALSPEAVLAMATLEGARALGLGRLAGSLEAGKRADLVAVEARGLSPADPTGGLLAAGRGEDVRTVWVEGEARYVRAGEPGCR